MGAGRVGRSLVAALAADGSAPGVELHGHEPEARPPETLVLCVPDDALEEAARARAGAFARATGGPDVTGREDSTTAAGAASGRARVALHTSGVHPASVLSSLREVGYAVAAWHPLTVVDRPDGSALRGVTWGVEGDAEALRRAERLTRALAGRTLRVDPGEHARYHAAAVFASNFLVACLSAGSSELSRSLMVEGGRRATASDGGEVAAASLLPLARAALAAVERAGLPEGLTGPVARGDVGTVRRHLAVLDGERRELYRRLSRELVRLVEAELPPGRADALLEALEGGEPG